VTTTQLVTEPGSDVDPKRRGGLMHPPMEIGAHYREQIVLGMWAVAADAPHLSTAKPPA
jgi:hypothetical protein